MSYLSWYLSLQVGRPVVDGTALEGFYDFTLAWLPNPELDSPGVHYYYRDTPEEHRDSSEEPAILVAVREQLGLKSQQRKAPTEVFIIDRVVKPQANRGRIDADTTPFRYMATYHSQLAGQPRPPNNE